MSPKNETIPEQHMPLTDRSRDSRSAAPRMLKGDSGYLARESFIDEALENEKQSEADELNTPLKRQQKPKPMEDRLMPKMADIGGNVSDDVMLESDDAGSRGSKP